MKRIGFAIAAVALAASSPSTATISDWKDFNCQQLELVFPTGQLNNSELAKARQNVTISAAYCSPPFASQHQPLQILLHGATYNKFEWSPITPAGYDVDLTRYSWTRRFLEQGHHILAIDRLGSGNSTRPQDPTLVTAETEEAILAQLIQHLRGKQPLKIAPDLPVPFKHLILVRHSYGSFVIDLFFRDHIEIANTLAAVILTGYTHIFDAAASSASKQLIVPARQVNPAKYASLDPGYTTIATAQNRRASFYGPDSSFDPLIAQIDFTTEDTATQGGANSITTSLGSRNFPAFVHTNLTVPLAFVLGQQDGFFCDGECGADNDDENIARRSRRFYLSIHRFGARIVPDTGHTLQLHYSAGDTFAWAAGWLRDVGL